MEKGNKESNRKLEEKKQRDSYKTKEAGELVKELVNIGDTSSIFSTGIGKRFSDQKQGWIVEELTRRIDSFTELESKFDMLVQEQMKDRKKIEALVDVLEKASSTKKTSDNVKSASKK